MLLPWSFNTILIDIQRREGTTLPVCLVLVLLMKFTVAWTETERKTQLRRPSPSEGGNVLFGDWFKLPPLTSHSGVIDGALILQRN